MPVECCGLYRQKLWMPVGFCWTHRQKLLMCMLNVVGPAGRNCWFAWRLWDPQAETVMCMLEVRNHPCACWRLWDIQAEIVMCVLEVRNCYVHAGGQKLLCACWRSETVDVPVLHHVIVMSCQHSSKHWTQKPNSIKTVKWLCSWSHSASFHHLTVKCCFLAW